MLLNHDVVGGKTGVTEKTRPGAAAPSDIQDSRPQRQVL
jgi:hypothetical protein